MRIRHTNGLNLYASGVLILAKIVRCFSVAAWLLMAAAGVVQAQRSSRTINLPTSKQLVEPAPGSPQDLNSLPMTVAVSPDGRYLAVVNAGFGTFSSRYQQSIAVLDSKTGKVTDFPEPRTAIGKPQTLYSGLAFGKDGTHLYAVFDSLTAPQGDGKEQTGNAVAVYTFSNGQLKPQQLLPVPLQQLPVGKLQNKIGAALPPGTAIPYPAGLAVRKGPDGTDELLVADNLSDDVLLMNGVTGKVLRRFDLSQGTVVPSTYPIAVTVNRSGNRAFVALWNGSAVAELDLSNGKVLKKLELLPPEEATSASSHPAAFAWGPDERTLYVALANRDAVAAMRVGSDGLKLLGLYDTRLPGAEVFRRHARCGSDLGGWKAVVCRQHRLGCGGCLQPGSAECRGQADRLRAYGVVSNRPGSGRQHALRGDRQGAGDRTKQ